ncbi:MAG: ribonuclease P protein component [Proteobacteria bacterium]|nr:ribonuclease P protein component [Pseudomonadota bacterium]MCH8237754.1 ribonuclease P protein component [Pseudomonadota bacterium]
MPLLPVLPFAEAAGMLRLKRRRQFLRVAGGGLKWVAPGLILQARCRDADERGAGPGTEFRLGLTVSRKVGSAVQRNRARRRLRAAAERVMPAHALGGHDFVLIGRSATLRRPFQALIGDLETALRKLDAYDG